MTTVQLHLRRTGARVWVVQVCGAMILHRVPPLSRILADLHPVVLAILDVAGVLQGLGEELSEVIVVGGILETKVSDVRQVLVELLGEALAEILDGSGLLLLTNLFIFLLVSSSLEALPGETATQEVHENVTKSLQIISSRLFAAKMRVDTHITGSTGKRLPLAVRDMLLGLGVSVLLGHTEVDHVDDVGRLGSWSSNQKVVGLDITVDEVLFVYRLDSGKHLLGDHDDGLDGEPTSAVVEKVLERRSEQVDDKDVVQTLLSEVVDIGNAGATNENLIRAVLIPKLWCITLPRFKFDGHLLVVQQIGSLKDDSKGTLSNFLADPVVDADDV